jgi:type II secretory pathway component PulF
MIVVGILAGAFFLYFLPHLLNIFESTEEVLPVYMRILVNIGPFRWFFGSCYLVLFIALICWFYKASPQPQKP